MRRLPVRYFLKETANNLWQYKTRHLLSLTIICLSFLIPGVFLALSNNLGQKARELSGDLNVVFYLQKGRAKLTVVSKNGKEATITLLAAGDFVGEESLATVSGLRLATASAVNTCVALKI
ncbi:MAG: cyclic nucleotide-binding domain-containing protein, partial [Candidatus Aminicenantales bacterium]